ncbi:hypothetical protein DPMN_162433 [Dreissena polymorpha]|uniref:Uncharacterized protein n=1 Tax=Dreissena polymorpha TaxID=45954 RepID=A0A9D4ERM6_DREPO|nr:hypothetical protein DPMN_162433 [Dreissena polymorpha]
MPTSSQLCCPGASPSSSGTTWRPSWGSHNITTVTYNCLVVFSFRGCQIRATRSASPQYPSNKAICTATTITTTTTARGSAISNVWTIYSQQLIETFAHLWVNHLAPRAVALTRFSSCHATPWLTAGHLAIQCGITGSLCETQPLSS